MKESITSGPLRIIMTADGSHTIFVPHLNESYHSTFGALTESMHVFIREGFHRLNGYESVSVFEIGFGTGLNALLTYLEAAKGRINICYHAIENQPLKSGIVDLLNYPDLLPGREVTAEIFDKMHRAAWDSYVPIGPGFTLHKIKADLSTYDPVFRSHIVYFDAFAPARQPEMWRKENFQKISNIMHPGGILVTYCVQGAVKRNLKATGFQVEILPGPPGKRHILRAMKDPEHGR
ncbi:MAG: tRNA (5-methylaminomethyl-2-thiouridine)(34)-methyltransferase MnmD [Bacteroidales bacterium]|nr:tRNA (5-methylaminomethyl-2-thiouridine)(34)-methyltransferase MnmD [Bacteroidales bacterium]